MRNRIELQFVKPDPGAFADACLKLAEEGSRSILLRPFNLLAADSFNKISGKVEVYTDRNESTVPVPDNVKDITNDVSIDATAIFETDEGVLSSILMDYIDADDVAIVAPITGRYFKNKPLFLISIPKSGTHLLYELAEAFGYREGIICPDNPEPGFWYCVEYSNSHTSARDFFIDTVRRSPFGNRDHPFVQSPAIFMYRNPLDIVVSEANYYHKDGKTAFYSYLSSLSFEERLLKLIDDPWLLGSIRERVGNFVAWLDFQNVMPVSFEEMIGPRGGGDIGAQRELIWSLQLKLHVPGNPEDYGNQVFNPESPTFRAGQIGKYREKFTPEAMEKFKALPQDFMEVLGYAFNEKGDTPSIPRRAEEFRKRLIKFSEVNFKEIPALVECYLNCTIVKYKGLFYGIPKDSYVNDLSKEKPVTLRKLYSARDLNTLRRKILLREGASWTLYLRKYNYWLKRLWGAIFSGKPFRER